MLENVAADKEPSQSLQMILTAPRLRLVWLSFTKKVKMSIYSLTSLLVKSLFEKTATFGGPVLAVRLERS